MTAGRRRQAAAVAEEAGCGQRGPRREEANGCCRLRLLRLRHRGGRRAGFLVVVSRNPVHSVLWLILAFLSSAGLFVLLGAEFVAMLLIIVYVGAVAVLFLFVVMMLDVDFAELKAGWRAMCRWQR
jgi:hypothetical protein